MPKVSVIVPVYNVEKYIDRCLESLVNQTLKDIEIIIVNDGSTDNSIKIVEEYKKKYKNKIIYLEKENGGLSDARNYGIPYAKGEYIAFLDSDDYVDRKMYEKLYNKAIENNSDIVECDFYWKYPNKLILDTRNEYKNINDMIKNGRVVVWNKLYNRKIIIDRNIMFTKGVRYEDIDFFYKLIPEINRLDYIKEPLVYYVQREASISKKQSEKNADIFIVLDNVIDYYKKNKIYDNYKDEIEYMYVRYLLASSFLRIVKIKDKNTREKLLNKTIDSIYTKFPNWKENKVLKKDKTLKNLYILTVNKATFKIYSKIFGILRMIKHG